MKVQWQIIRRQIKRNQLENLTRLFLMAILMVRSLYSCLSGQGVYRKSEYQFKSVGAPCSTLTLYPFF